MRFEDVFTFSNLYKSCKDCYKGVNWKTSTKNYQTRSIQNVVETLIKLQDKKYKQKPFAKFSIFERGKYRQIQALHISDRVVQKCFCDNFLVPLFSKRLIYDNGACMKNKGLLFTANRLKTHLQQYYRENNTNAGYVLTFDFSKFFDSINHEILLQKARKVIIDERLYNLYKYFVNSFEGENGLGLGSQISQVSALYYTNDMDHYIKEHEKMKYYGRYMDDGYIISSSKEKLKECLQILIEFSNKLKLKLNIKKTKISRIDKGFMFLNRHWILKQTGYVKTKPSHTTLKRLKKRYRKIIKIATPEAVERYKSSTSGFIKFFNNRRLYDYVYN